MTGGQLGGCRPAAGTDTEWMLQEMAPELATLTMPTLVSMTREISDRLRRAVDRHKAAATEEEAARQELHAVILEATDEGYRQVEIVRETGYTREHIRRIVRDTRAERDRKAAEQ